MILLSHIKTIPRARQDRGTHWLHLPLIRGLPRGAWIPCTHLRQGQSDNSLNGEAPRGEAEGSETRLEARGDELQDCRKLGHCCLRQRWDRGRRSSRSEVVHKRPDSVITGIHFHIHKTEFLGQLRGSSPLSSLIFPWCIWIGRYNGNKQGLGQKEMLMMVRPFQAAFSHKWGPLQPRDPPLQKAASQQSSRTYKR